MKYQNFPAVVALAQIVSAISAHHLPVEAPNRARDLYTKWKIETVTKVTTIWGPGGPGITSFPATPATELGDSTSSAMTTIPTSDLGTGENHKGQTGSSSGGEAGGSPSTADPTHSTTFSTAIAPVSSTTDAASTGSSTVNSGGLGLSPNGKKAGLSGFVGIQQLDAFDQLTPYISWYSDYTPNPPTTDGVTGIGMLWGANGSPCGSEVTNRLSTFKSFVENTTPKYMFGFYEPDCYCSDSSEMSSSSGTDQWNKYLAPLGKNGVVLGSPSMCKQKDETWLQPFRDGGLDHDWLVTSVHINKPDIQGVMEDIEYYAATYKKPIWVSEFACVHDVPDWQPCTDQNEINQFINDAVKYFQQNDTVVAYGPSNGNGLGNTWPMVDAVGNLTQSGQTYLNAIKSI